MKVAYIFSTLLFLAGCASQQEQKAFKIVGDYFGAKANYAKGYSSQLGKESENYISLSLTGGPYINAEKPDQLAVYAAVLLYENLSKEEAQKYTTIKINLFEEGAGNIALYKRNYDIKDIKNIAAKSQYFKQVADFLKANDIKNIYNLLDENHRSDDEREQFESAVSSMMSERQGIKSAKLLGVELLIVKESNVRILKFYGDVQWNTDTTTMLSVRTFEDSSAKNIIHLNIK